LSRACLGKINLNDRLSSLNIKRKEIIPGITVVVDYEAVSFAHRRTPYRTFAKTGSGQAVALQNQLQQSL
jgi:hypothetical protein